MLIEIAIAIVSKVGEYLVEPTINQACYLFRFNKIVEDLMEAERKLELKQGDVEKEIEAAERNAERIKATIQDWLFDSRKIMQEVETLKEKIEVNKTCLNGWCPNWGSRHQLGRKATKTSIQLKKIIDKGQFGRVGCRALLLGEHEGVALLKKEAGIDDDCVNLNTLATRITRECGGLPLALVTTGRIGVGLDLYEGVSSIEEARGDLRLIVEALKALGGNIFMSKIRMDLTQLKREKCWKQCTAISLLENKLKELYVRLECPKLKILLLGGENQWLQLKVSDECFQKMKALEVVSLRYADLSLKSLQFLTNLKTLELFGCNLRDICFLAKLNKLEILSFRGSRFDELPIALSELKELRMLDLRGCSELERIPSNLIQSFSQLEELYIEKDIFEEREVEEKSIETAGLMQLKNLEIGDATELKQVFDGKEENEIAEEGKDIKLPNLKKLKLYKLEKLTRFFLENNHSTLSALEAPKIDESPEEQAPEMSSEDDTQEEQAPEIGSEDESHEETSTDLICRLGDFEKLPRYIKIEELYSNSHPIE
ncbi:hypothetical protein Pint_36702 [Pistacia integerrima]|uniref:Uncharacterized protein n=1 Tax=Pistacia integerrima TaxID=434235 RepID=A0ACC0Y0I2_9ROSI|nr:hypothetical protein Pint_36702 [Pistacia integerrima]